MAVAFSPQVKRLLARRVFAVLSLPIMVFSIVLNDYRNVYRTGEMKGVVTFYKQRPGHYLPGIFTALAMLMIPMLALGLTLLPFVPLEVTLGVSAIIVMVSGVAAAWFVAAGIVVLAAGSHARRAEEKSAQRAGREPLPHEAPKGTAKLNYPRGHFIITGAANKGGGESSGHYVLSMTRALIQDLPGGSVVVAFPRTGRLRAAYERGGFVASGRKKMVLVKPS